MGTKGGSDDPGPVHVCEYCQTVLVLTGPGPALRIVGRDLDKRGASDRWVTALCCRLCGGPLPETVTRERSDTRCSYCGHPALLGPTIRAVLRLAFTKPRLLPPAVRRPLIHLAVACGVLVAMTLFGMHTIGAKHVETFQADFRGQRVWTQTIRMQPYHDSLELRIEGSKIPGTARFGVRYQHVRADRCAYGILQVSGGSKGDTVKAGSTHQLFLPQDEIEVALAAPKKVRRAVAVEIVTRGRFPFGWTILMVNIVLWMLIFELRGATAFQAPNRRRASILSLVTVASLLFYGLITVVGFDPWPDTRMGGDHQCRAPTPPGPLESGRGK